MTPDEVMAEVRRIEITTRHLVRDIVAGEYSSAFRGRGVEFSEPLKDTHDGLRGFELEDADGYVLFFGRPR